MGSRRAARAHQDAAPDEVRVVSDEEGGASTAIGFFVMMVVLMLSLHWVFADIDKLRHDVDQLMQQHSAVAK